MAKRGENIHKRKDGAGRDVISKDALPMETDLGLSVWIRYGKLKTN